MTPDATIVGSGPNGLAAAIVLASHGLRVRVFEAATGPGGGAATEELTLPGFRHDVCSAVHPLGVASPLFRALPLGAFGVDWVHSPAPLVHPFADDPVTLERSPADTAAGLRLDGRAYRALLAPWVDGWDEVLRGVLGAPAAPRTLARLPAVAWPAAGSAAGLARRAFVEDRARALVAGLAAHAILPLERSPSAGVALLLAAAGHAVGWPFPRGGSGSLSRALVRLLERLGGEVVTGVRIRSPVDLPPARATLFDLGPGPLAEILGDHLPPRYRRTLGRYRYGPGAFKIDWALSEPIPWNHGSCRRAATLHLGGSFEEVARSERAAWRGEVIDRPFVLLAQPSLFDASRAPAGRHVAWAYCHVPAGSPVDMRSRIEAQVERFAPGFRQTILAAATRSARDLERSNPNLVGGDVGGGALTWRQLAARPRLLRPHATPLPDVFLCSASTPPGAGVHGMCGFHAARLVLERRFGVRTPQDPSRALGPALAGIEAGGGAR